MGSRFFHRGADARAVIRTAAGALVALLLAAPAQAFRSVEEGGPIPPFNLTSTAGDEIAISAGGEQALVLAFVRQGQEKSADALKALQEVLDNLGDKAAVVAVVVNPGEGDAAAWAKSAGATFPVLLDADGAVYGQYGVRVMPSTGIVKPDGVLASTVDGFTRGYAGEIEQQVKLALGLVTVEEVAAAAKMPTETKSEARKTAERSLEKARLLLKRRMSDKAVASAQEAVAADGEYVEAQVFLGDLLLDVSDDNAGEALVHYEKALELQPKSVDAKVGIARVKSLQGDSETAAKLLQEAAMLNPKPEKVYFELGRVYERAGDYKQAVEAYRKALERLL